MNPATPYVPGIDVSHYQGVIDWVRVKAAGIQFAFLKATDGLSTDPTFRRNRAACLVNDIPCGAYHFFRPAADPSEQAELFIKVALDSNAMLPPALDIEIGPVAADSLFKWLELVEAQFAQKPLVYVAPGFARQFLGGAAVTLAAYPLWIAEYGPPATPQTPGWLGWTFWQHSGAGQVDGIMGQVDLDWFNGSADDLRSRVFQQEA